MKVNLYSVRDNKVGFLMPMQDANDEAAKRNFAYSINNADDIRGFAPADYDLFRVGEFDSESGQLIPLPVPEFLISGGAVFNE